MKEICNAPATRNAGGAANTFVNRTVLASAASLQLTEIELWPETVKWGMPTQQSVQHFCPLPFSPSRGIGLDGALGAIHSCL